MKINTRFPGTLTPPVTRSVGRFAAASGLVVIALIAAGLRGPHPDDPAADGIDRVAWLAGCWEGTLSNGAAYEEMWLPPRGGTMIGVARMTRDGRTLSFEFMRIATDDHDALVYTAQPSGRPPTHFHGTAIDASAATFENPEHDFPQRILYRLTSPEDLLARIEGERDGQLRGIDFPLRRVACPG
jgi:hypothetical protein